MNRILLGIGLSLAASSVASAGVLNGSAFTFVDDSGTGISAAKTYTHAVDFNGRAASLTINGVTFTGGGSNANNTAVAAPITGSNFSLNDTGNFISFVGNTNALSGNIATLEGDFYYNQTGTATQTLTLTGLTPGVAYKTTFYQANFGGATVDFTANDTPTATTGTFDRGTGNGAGGKGVTYDYTLPVGQTSIAYTFVADNGADGMHQYGFTNEVVPEPASLSLLALGGASVLARRRRNARA